MSAGFRKDFQSSLEGDDRGCAALKRSTRFFVVGADGSENLNSEVSVISVPRKPATRINERIRIPQVRVIDEDGKQLGIMTNVEALNLAQGRGLDLVEISPTARPPVCKIMDYGKFKYEESKQARKARRSQHVMLIKEIKLRPKIDDHDYDFKVNHAREFLGHKDKVKFMVIFRGREMVHMDRGRDILNSVIKDLEDIGVIESPARVEGRTMTLYMIPKKDQPGQQPPKKPSPQSSSQPGKETGHAET